MTQKAIPNECPNCWGYQEYEKQFSERQNSECETEIINNKTIKTEKL